jgi:hypothetical protein
MYKHKKQTAADSDLITRTARALQKHYYMRLITYIHSFCYHLSLFAL